MPFVDIALLAAGFLEIMNLCGMLVLLGDVDDSGSLDSRADPEVRGGKPDKTKLRIYSASVNIHLGAISRIREVCSDIVFVLDREVIHILSNLLEVCIRVVREGHHTDVGTEIEVVIDVHTEVEHHVILAPGSPASIPLIKRSAKTDSPVRKYPLGSTDELGVGSAVCRNHSGPPTDDVIPRISAGRIGRFVETCSGSSIGHSP